MTAAGTDPALLARLPYRVRHYAAAMPDRAALFRLAEDAAGDPAMWLDCPGLQGAKAMISFPIAGDDIMEWVNREPL